MSKIENQDKTELLIWDTDYNGAAIYSLVDENGRRYVGQAQNLQNRLKQHRKAFNRIKDGESKPIGCKEGKRLVEAIEAGVTFRVEVCKRLTPEEATKNSLRHWECEIYEQYANGIPLEENDLYNSTYPAPPKWECEDLNELLDPTAYIKKRRKSQDKYNKEKTVQFKMKLNVHTDADIIEKLESVPNKQGYIKDLIRADIEREERLLADIN